MTSPQDQNDARASRVTAAATRWRQALADVGGRNTLLWHRDSPLGVLDLTVAHPSGTAKLLAANVTRLTELVREPHAYAEALERAVAIRRKAVELTDGHGLRTCFLAVGTATWRIAGAVTPPRAPVLLRSCRIEPVDATYRDLVLSIGEDITFNPALTHYLREQQGLPLDPTWLAGLARGPHGFDARPAFDALEEICAELPGFAIAPQLVVSTFPWSKLGTVADVVAHQDRLAEHDVVAALAGDAGARRTLTDGASGLRALLAAQDLGAASPALVLDADEDQLRAVRAARTGAHLVVTGAAGNGTTQTVANLAAALVADGRRVLVVAEKQTGLDAVRRRLDAAGLGDLTVQVGDDAVAAQRAAQTLLMSLDAAQEAPDAADLDAVTTDLEHARAQAAAAFGLLHRDAELVHRRRAPWGASVHGAEQELTRLAHRPHPPVSRVRLSAADLRVDGVDEMNAVAERLTEAAREGAWSGGADDPWYGARITTAEQADQVLAAARRLAGTDLAAARATMGQAVTSVGLTEPGTLAAWREELVLLEDVLESLDTFTPEVFDVPLDDYVAATAEGADKDEDARDMGAFTRSRLRRAARRLLRPGPPPADLHGRLRSAREQRQRWERLGGRMARPEAVRDLEPAASAFERVSADVTMLGSVLAETHEPERLRAVPLDELAALAQRLVDRRDRLDVVPRVSAILDDARAAGFGDLVDDLVRRSVDAQDVADETRFVWYASLLDEARAEHGEEHDPERLRKAWRTFLREDRTILRREADLIGLGVRQRAHELLSRAPEEVLRLRRRFEQVTRPEELRIAWRTGGGVVPTVRPVVLASPLAVGATMPVGRLFDVVIVHQAGQVPVEHAIPAIMRARQVILTGDRHQAPPRAFTVVADRRAEQQAASPSPATRPRSLLDAATELLPVIELHHHYRCLDERLVTALERRVYPRTMATVPGTHTAPPVVVDEVGGERRRAAQASRVVELILDHARRRPAQSLGVATFSAARAAELDAALRSAISGSQEFVSSFRENAAEAFFIKPAHQAVGDARDAVIVDVEGFEDEAEGSVLDLPEGMGLVTTALSAARRRLHLVVPAGLLAGAEENSALGLLAAAATPQPTPSHSVEGSPILLDLAARLRKEGLTVSTRYGRGDAPVELAVFDPEQPARPLLAVLTDAPWGERLEILDREDSPDATRRLATWGRDWERIRTEQLMRLGWATVRVWHTEMFTDPARVVARVTGAVRDASAARAAAHQPTARQVR